MEDSILFVFRIKNFRNSQMSWVINTENVLWMQSVI